MITIQSKLRPRLVCFLCVCSLWTLPGRAASNSDDFNDNSKNTSKWGLDDKSGRGVLTERNQRLEYTCSGPTPDDFFSRRWVLTRFPCSGDWEIQVDTVNTTVPTLPVQVNSAGITIHHPRNAKKELYIELYSSQLGGPPSRTGFEFALDDDEEKLVASGGGSFLYPETNSAVRVVFNASTKVITGFYDSDRSDGYQWTEFGSFGLAGTGGYDGNVNWELGDNEQFSADLYGYSAFMNIASGQIYLDNFRETGGVTPSGAPTPDPVGRFPFSFPTDNPLLTRILSLTGNYQGRSALLNDRQYSVDIAQDESGKISGMGMLEGVRDKNGSSELSGNVGAIKTISGEPTAQIKSSFAGSVDGVNANLGLTATVPLKLVEIGYGTNGVAGTASYKGRIGGVPFAAKNAPVAVVPSPEALNTARADWSLELDLSRKPVKGKEKTVASAQLQLPNGDTIRYPEKVVKYSVKNGYTLAFRNGTNVTVTPNRIDRKSSITIKKLTFVKQGDDWEPTGGTITYQFLGQKGTANLLDFVRP